MTTTATDEPATDAADGTATTAFDPEAGGDYPADLYHADHVLTTDRVGDRLTDDQLAFYRENGFLALRDLFSPDDVRDALRGLSEVVFTPGEARVQFEESARGRVEQLTPDERLDAVRRLMSFSGHPALGALAHSPRLLTLVRQLTGDNDVVMFQDMALLKPPGGGREKPWHQDNAFFRYEPGTPIVGVWIALDHATPENGCMHVRPGSHRDGAKVHFRRRDWQLCDTDNEPVRDATIPLEPGGALLFDGLLHHGTPANRTRTRRRALQFHYLPSRVLPVPEDRRLEIFGSEGKDVSC